MALCWLLVMFLCLEDFQDFMAGDLPRVTFAPHQPSPQITHIKHQASNKSSFNDEHDER
jgi:hypothetical protein